MGDELRVSQADIFKALAHPVRLQILQMLQQGERCVCELVAEIETEQPNISRHLAILKKDGILGCRKDGLKVMYWVRDRRAFKLLELSREMLKSYWQEKSGVF
ncbi:MAG: metalloregulator ArsR/SmtB family transcription factor [Bacillota bacterium]